MAGDDVTHSDESGSISPAGRFARMEASLLRIEDKLDLKADEARVDGIEVRVKFIEDHGSLEAREAIEIARANAISIHNIESQGTPKMQEVVAIVADLKNKDIIRATEIKTTKETTAALADARYAQMRTIVTISSVINGVLVAFGAILTALSMLHVI